MIPANLHSFKSSFKSHLVSLRTADIHTFSLICILTLLVVMIKVTLWCMTDFLCDPKLGKCPM